MRGSENNDMWAPGDDVPELEGAKTGDADGALGGRSTGAPYGCWYISNHQAAYRGSNSRCIFRVTRNSH